MYPKIDHLALAKKRVISQYKNLPVFNKMLEAVVSGLNDLESAFHSLRTDLFFEDANLFHVDKFASLLNLRTPENFGRAFKKVDIYLAQAKFYCSRQHNSILNWFKKIANAKSTELIEYKFGFILMAGYSDISNVNFSDIPLKTFNESLSPVGVKIEAIGVYTYKHTFRFSDGDSLNVNANSGFSDDNLTLGRFASLTLTA